MLGLRIRGWCAPSLALAAGFVLVGCGGLDLGSGDDGEAGNGGTEGANDGAGTAGADTTGGPGDGDGDGAGDGAGEPDCGPYFCDDGTCIDEGGTPYCECDEGFVLRGSTCEPCDTVDAASFDVAIAMVDFEGQVLIDGELAQSTVTNRGQVVAVETRTGDRVVLTDTRDGNFDVAMVPGVYDLYYELLNGGTLVPRNEHAYLETVTLEEDVSRFQIDLRPVRISGDLQLNGAAFPSSPTNRGELFLEDPDTGDRARLGRTMDGTYDALVLPGQYDVYYELRAGGTTVPRNSHGLVAAGLTIDDGFADPIDVPMITVDGPILIDGATPTTSLFDDGNLWLRSPDGLDEIPLGNTHDGNYSVNVLPGTYEVIYGLESGGVTVPRNRAAHFDTIDVKSSATVSLDITTATVSGTITLDGAPPSTSFFDDGRIWLASPDGRDEAPLGLTSEGSYSALVVAGSYELRYGVESAGATVPRNTNAFLDSVDVVAQPQVDVDIPTVAIDGGITVGGAVPPASIYQSARIFLRSPDRKDSLELAKTHEGSYQRRVIPGTYDVMYVEDGATQLPGNLNGDVLEGLQLNSDMSVAINVPVVDLAGTVTLDGGTPPSGNDDVGRIVLERRAENDTVLVTRTNQASFSSSVVPGTYDVYYQVEQTAGAIPNNERARLACVQIQP